MSLWSAAVPLTPNVRAARLQRPIVLDRSSNGNRSSDAMTWPYPCRDLIHLLIGHGCGSGGFGITREGRSRKSRSEGCDCPSDRFHGFPLFAEKSAPLETASAPTTAVVSRWSNFSGRTTWSGAKDITSAVCLVVNVNVPKVKSCNVSETRSYGDSVPGLAIVYQQARTWNFSLEARLKECKPSGALIPRHPKAKRRMTRWKPGSPTASACRVD
jgi:hypothetical protein